MKDHLVKDAPPPPSTPPHPQINNTPVQTNFHHLDISGDLVAPNLAVGQAQDAKRRAARLQLLHIQDEEVGGKATVAEVQGVQVGAVVLQRCDAHTHWH